MKANLLNIFFCVAAIASHLTSNGTRDSLPPCIATLMINNKLDISEYDYKGQHWFVTAKQNPKVENYSDKLTTIQFYNANCNPVCTWQKGGIAGLNKVTPDTIDKKKIILLRTIKFDTLQSTYTNQRQLPDTIIKIGIRKNAMHIQEYVYKGQTLYNLHLSTSGKTRQELLAKGIITIDEPYYDEKGKIIIIYKRAIEGMFMRASKWVPSSVKQVDVIKVTNGIWHNNRGEFENTPLKINDK